MVDLTEKAYLSELIRDFPPRKTIDVEDAWKQIQIRYSVLDANKENYVSLASIDKRPFNEILLELAKRVHSFMFDNVLSNAGEFRKATDPHNGFVTFGPELTRTAWGSKFKGTSPTQIDIELKSAFAILSKEDHDPIRHSILFLCPVVSLSVPLTTF